MKQCVACVFVREQHNVIDNEEEKVECNLFHCLFPSNQLLCLLLSVAAPNSKVRDGQSSFLSCSNSNDLRHCCYKCCSRLHSSVQNITFFRTTGSGEVHSPLTSWKPSRIHEIVFGLFVGYCRKTMASFKRSLPSSANYYFPLHEIRQRGWARWEKAVLFPKITHTLTLVFLTWVTWKRFGHTVQ